VSPMNLIFDLIVVLMFRELSEKRGVTLWLVKRRKSVAYVFCDKLLDVVHRVKSN